MQAFQGYFSENSPVSPIKLSYKIIYIYSRKDLNVTGTLSFKPYSDKAIPLENLKTNISNSPSNYVKTDTIVQNSSNYDQVFISSIKKSPMSNMTTINFPSEQKKFLNKGAFNTNIKGMSGQDTWKPSKRWIYIVSSLYIFIILFI